MIRFALLLLLLPATAAAAPTVTVCKGALVASVPGGCASVPSAGCCDPLGRNLWCQGNDLYCVDCADGFASCGWNPLGLYDCGQAAGSVDPSGNASPSCDACPAGCDGAPCSAQCKGLCGACGGGQTCLDDGTCYAPQCGGKSCGKDAKGFSCGTCGKGEVCVEELGACQAPPLGCGPRAKPGCEGCSCEGCVCDKYPTCCTDSWDLFCATACEQECDKDCSPCPAEPTCGAVECGAFCGIDCGGCGAGQVCLYGQCCTQQCSGKECGQDGCGGTCGSCAPFDPCVQGTCEACVPACDGKECGDDGCGGICGACGAGDTCIGGQCLGCIPKCDDKQCGDDGCGGECGPCLAGQVCNGGACTGCGVLGWVGCCDGDVTRWCQSGEPQARTCEGGCGWDGEQGWYDCGFTGADPSGLHGRACQSCVPACQGRACGDDGCGGTCGACAAGLTCDGGQCAAAGCGDVPAAGCCGGGAVEYCDGGNLGGYSCATTCGWDPAGRGGAGWYDCGFTGADPSGASPRVCPGCVASCDGRECGDDGCGGSCGACGAGESCAAGVCEPCASSCAGKECGGDGCGGSCGTCGAGQSCASGVCEGCAPSCAGKECGDDGCGGSCGACGAGESCTGGACTGCAPSCEGRACGDDGCGGTCGACEAGESCDGGACVCAGCDGGAGTADAAADTATNPGDIQPTPAPTDDGCGAAPGGASAPGLLLILMALGCLLTLMRRRRAADRS